MFVVNDEGRERWYLRRWYDIGGTRHTLWTSSKQDAMDYYDRKAAAAMVKILRQNGYKAVRIVE